jgi:hypothetical protein
MQQYINPALAEWQAILTPPDTARALQIADDHITAEQVVEQILYLAMTYPEHNIITVVQTQALWSQLPPVVLRKANELRLSNNNNRLRLVLMTTVEDVVGFTNAALPANIHLKVKDPRALMKQVASQVYYTFEKSTPWP